MARAVVGGARGPRRWVVPLAALALVGAVAVAGWLALAPRESPPEEPPRAGGFSIPDGAFRAYELEWRSEARLQLASVGGPETRGWVVEGRARLLLKYFAGGSGWDVAARMDGANLRLDGQPADPSPGFELPFSFHQDRQGYLTDFAWAPGLPEQTRVLLRQSLSRLQVVLSVRETPAWNTRERDALGAFRAAYSSPAPRGLQLRKSKLDYLPEPRADAAGGDAPIVQRVVASDIELELLPGAAGLARARVRETLRAEDAQSIGGEETTVFEARLVGAPDPFGDSFPALAAERDRPFTAPRELAGSPAPAAPNAPGSLREALRSFAELFGPHRQAAEAAVLAWLRSGRSAPPELLGFLEECSRGAHPSLDAARQAVLFRLLAQAGTPESLDALLAAASGEGYAMRTRRLAVGHMDQVPVAQARQVEALLALHAEQRQTGGSESAELANMALLAAGALGHRDLAPAEVSAQVVEQLSARLAAARSAEERAEVLGAMGNSGDARLLEAITPALSDPEPAIRTAAARSLRRMESDELAPLLLGRYPEERDPGTRAALVEVLGRGAPTDTLLQWARQEAPRAGDAASLLAFVDLLGKTLAVAPANEEVLRQVLARAPNRKVEQRVLRYIAPRPGH